MKIKTAELTGATLDWAVAKAQGLRVVHYRTWLETENEYWKGKVCDWAGTEGYRVITDDNLTADILPYSTEWTQGGPIIEMEKISILEAGEFWGARPLQDGVSAVKDSYGPTPLIAAMRCYVASKLGGVVEVPDTY